MTGRLAAALEASGLRPQMAAVRAAWFERAEGGLPPAGRSEQPARFFVPGRIEVLGKHTDYGGGRSLVCAIERGISLVSRPRADRQVRIVDVTKGSERAFELAPELQPQRGDWSNYPMTVARRLARNFPGAALGADMAFASDLPAASGLSSSSALMIGVYFALAAANELDRTEEYGREIRGPLDLAGYLATVENGQSFGALRGDRGVGTFGGSEDHTAIICARAGRVSQYAFNPVRHERDLPMPDGHVFVVAVSGIAAEKTGAAQATYNRASRLLGVVLEMWAQASGRSATSLSAAIASGPDGVARLRSVLAESHNEEFPASDLLDRFEHFVEENERLVPAVADAFADGRVEHLGELVERSQHAAERLLGNQIPETIALARDARQLGAVAASAFGAGFGGSVWALVEAGQAPTFAEAWLGRYRAAFPAAAGRAQVFVTSPGPAAFRLPNARA